MSKDIKARCPRCPRHGGRVMRPVNTNIETIKALLLKPIIADPDDVMHDELFNPWDLFPCLYGSYSCEFDDLAIAVLEDIQRGTYETSGLAQEMFREMLCVADLCDYGTSPRVCFPTKEFGAILPDLIAHWRAHRKAYWGLDE